jgi:pimeloyl-ACP methyl ester carboxylesterase
MMRQRFALLVVCVSLAGGAALVASHVQTPVAGSEVVFRGKRLAVPLARGAANRDGPVLLYVTGDGGFPGTERLFERMAPWGYPMVAIDAVDYIESINTPERVLAPLAVAADLQAVIRTALAGLDLPADRAAVLVGFSRGAGLSLAAATEPALRARLRGMLLLALPANEEFVTEGGRAFRPYDALSRLTSLRVALIQSTRDDLLPAADAGRRFGPESPVRRFRALAATDHSFGGSLPELEVEMRAAVEWIRGTSNPGTPGTPEPRMSPGVDWFLR